MQQHGTGKNSADNWRIKGPELALSGEVGGEDTGASARVPYLRRGGRSRRERETPHRGGARREFRKARRLREHRAEGVHAAETVLVGPSCPVPALLLHEPQPPRLLLLHNVSLTITISYLIHQIAIQLSSHFRQMITIILVWVGRRSRELVTDRCGLLSSPRRVTATIYVLAKVIRCAAGGNHRCLQLHAMMLFGGSSNPTI